MWYTGRPAYRSLLCKQNSNNQKFIIFSTTAIIMPKLKFVCPNKINDNKHTNTVTRRGGYSTNFISTTVTTLDSIAKHQGFPLNSAAYVRIVRPQQTDHLPSLVAINSSSSKNQMSKKTNCSIVNRANRKSSGYAMGSLKEKKAKGICNINDLFLFPVPLL